MRRLFTVAMIAACVWGGWRHWQLRQLEQGPGVLAPAEPRQARVPGDIAPFTRGEFTIKPLARYELRARLLSREAYRSGTEAELSPLDFALGWGPMSDSTVLDQLEVSQSARYFSLRWQEPPLPPDVLLSHAANTHLIPADGLVEKALSAMRPGQIVTLRGYLVQVERGDGWRWNSSLTRKDTGAGACELFWVEDASAAAI